MEHLCGHPGLTDTSVTCVSITARAFGGAESHDVSFVPQSQPVVFRTDAAVNGPVSVGCQLQSSTGKEEI